MSHGSLGGPGRAVIPMAGACTRRPPLPFFPQGVLRVVPPPPLGGVGGIGVSAAPGVVAGPGRAGRFWSGHWGRASPARSGRRRRRRAKRVAAPVIQAGPGRPGPSFRGIPGAEEAVADAADPPPLGRRAGLAGPRWALAGAAPGSVHQVKCSRPAWVGVLK